MPDLKVGQHVVVLDAYNKLHPGVVIVVPEEWRDASGSEATTMAGLFPKAWVCLKPVGAEGIPWPLTHVFTDLATAEAAQRKAVVNG